jgi:hypothetical protein
MPYEHFEHCDCPGGGPGGRAVISPTGCCPRCGVQGSRRAAAIRDALASQNWGSAIEDARHAGWVTGYLVGLAEGRGQAIAALLDPAASPAPALIGTSTPEPQGAAA